MRELESVPVIVKLNCPTLVGVPVIVPSLFSVSPVGKLPAGRLKVTGGGLSVLPEFLVSEDVKSGALRHVLPDWHLPAGGIYTVFPAAGFRPTKVAVFVEILIAALHKRTLTHSAQG